MLVMPREVKGKVIKKDDSFQESGVSKTGMHGWQAMVLLPIQLYVWILPW